MSNQNIVPTTKEIEAKFFVEPEEIRKKLVSLNAELIEKEKPMRRKVFGIAHDNKYFRVRDENSSITMTCKVITGKGIHDVLETEIKVDNFDKACEILELTGLPVKSYQETTREI
jgi:adenylate cyclase class IV